MNMIERPQMAPRVGTPVVVILGRTVLRLVDAQTHQDADCHPTLLTLQGPAALLEPKMAGVNMPSSRQRKPKQIAGRLDAIFGVGAAAALANVVCRSRC